MQEKFAEERLSERKNTQYALTWPSSLRAATNLPKAQVMTSTVLSWLLRYLSKQECDAGVKADDHFNWIWNTLENLLGVGPEHSLFHNLDAINGWLIAWGDLNSFWKLWNNDSLNCLLFLILESDPDMSSLLYWINTELFVGEKDVDVSTPKIYEEHKGMDCTR